MPLWRHFLQRVILIAQNHLRFGYMNGKNHLTFIYDSYSWTCKNPMGFLVWYSWCVHEVSDKLGSSASFDSIHMLAHSAFPTHFHPVVAEMFCWDCNLYYCLSTHCCFQRSNLGCIFMINYVPSFRFLVHTEGRQLRLLLFGFAIATTPGRLANTARSPAMTRFARDDRVKSSACKNMEGFQKCGSIVSGMRKHVLNTVNHGTWVCSPNMVLWGNQHLNPLRRIYTAEWWTNHVW